MSEAVLNVRGLRKTFRASPKGLQLRGRTVEALKGVDFDIFAGTVTGFLGANGAGKTTTIKCLLNLAFPDAGEIRYFGDPQLTPEAKARIGFLPERPYFYEYLTGREFLRFYGELSERAKGAALGKRIEELLERVGLAHAGDRPLRSYSKGMLQRIGIAQALIHSPEFVILDEPMTGLDPDGRIHVRDIIRETADAGTAVFFSSHLLPDAEQLCDHLVILKQGNLVYGGKTADLLGRVEKGFRLTSVREGKLIEEDCVTAADLQGAIDRVRSAGHEVREVKALKLTLEEAFARIAFDKNGSSGEGAA
jgi:ABC-2 type transport system ATP-binding protein